jgi:tRNA-2-methylthio-N6-dimethylallyladenosine synthase
VEEIRNLVADGVKEVMLLGQNVNSYGKNLEREITFPDLLRMVEAIDGLERIRFMTSHPKDLSDDLIACMKESKKICRHLHLPLQSGSTRLLKAMNRHYTKESYLELAKKIRREIPDMAITTDIIVGFPGETYEDIQDTLDVIREVEFDNAFTFIYSKRTGTPAAVMPNQVAKEDIKVWFDEVLSLVQECARKRTAMLDGQIADVLVEGMNEQDDTLVTGRMSNNTLVHFKGDASLIGTIVNVKLNECKGFYYIGERVD